MSQQTTSKTSPTATDTTATDTSASTTSTNATMDFPTFLYQMYNQSNVIFLVLFVVIYLIAYLILGLFFNTGNGQISTFQLRLSRFLDLFFFIGFLITIVLLYYGSSSNTSNNVLLSTFLQQFADYIDAPLSFFSTLFFIVVFYTVIYFFGIPMSSGTKPIFIMVVENLTWILLLIIVFVDFFKYILHIDIVKSIEAIIGPTTSSPQTTTTDVSGNATTDVSGNATTDISKNEVFNIGNNLYTFDDAQAICSSYGATIATYDQVEDAYNNGGEWCNYGWSDGQMILFPTQKSTWQKLQKSKDHKNDCGRPGINGGYVANPYVKFGVNCYGTKPQPNPDDISRLTAKVNQVAPKSTADKALDAKVEFWKENASKMLQINSFNTKSWSEW